MGHPWEIEVKIVYNPLLRDMLKIR